MVYILYMQSPDEIILLFQLLYVTDSNFHLTCAFEGIICPLTSVKNSEDRMVKLEQWSFVTAESHAPPTDHTTGSGNLLPI